MIGWRYLVAAAATVSAVPVVATTPLKPSEVSISPAFGYILLRVVSPSPTVIELNRFTIFRQVVSLAPQYYDSKKRKEIDAATVSGNNTLAVNGKMRTYLVAVRPGEWLFTAVRNTSFSLGTYGLPVRAGEVTDAGTFFVGPEDGKSTVPEIAAAVVSDDLDGTAMTDALMVKQATEQDPVPALLASARIVRPILYRDLRFPNVYGTLVNRAIGLPPMAHIAEVNASVR